LPSLRCLTNARIPIVELNTSFCVPFVFEGYLQTGVKIGSLTDMFGPGYRTGIDIAENFLVGHNDIAVPCLSSARHRGRFLLRFPPALEMIMTLVSENIRLSHSHKRIDDAYAHAVQTACHTIAVAVEFPPACSVHKRPLTALFFASLCSSTGIPARCLRRCSSVGRLSARLSCAKTGKRLVRLSCRQPRKPDDEGRLAAVADIHIGSFRTLETARIFILLASYLWSWHIKFSLLHIASHMKRACAVTGKHNFYGPDFCRWAARLEMSHEFRAAYAQLIQKRRRVRLDCQYSCERSTILQLCASAGAKAATITGGYFPLSHIAGNPGRARLDKFRQRLAYPRGVVPDIRALCVESIRLFPMREILSVKL